MNSLLSEGWGLHLGKLAFASTAWRPAVLALVAPDVLSIGTTEASPATGRFYFGFFGNLRSRAASRTRSAALWPLRAKLRLVQGLLSEAVSSLVGTKADFGRADALV